MLSGRAKEKSVFVQTVVSQGLHISAKFREAVVKTQKMVVKSACKRTSLKRKVI